MKKGQSVSPGVVIVVLVVVIAFIGFLFFKGMSRSSAVLKPPEGKTPMVGPMGMQKMGMMKGQVPIQAPQGQQPNTMPQAPAPSGN